MEKEEFEEEYQKILKEFIKSIRGLTNDFAQKLVDILPDN